MAADNDTVCVGTVTGVHDNVVAPPNATCIVTNAVVRGNVKALAGSTTQVQFSEVGGNVQGVGALRLTTFFADVGGNVAADGGETLVVLSENHIGGSIDAERVNQVQVTGFGDLIEVGQGIRSQGGTRFTTICDVTVLQGNVHVLKVNGNVFVGGGGGSGAACPTGVDVRNGNLIVEDNVIPPSFSMTVGGLAPGQSNTVSGNLQVFNNRGVATKRVQFNTVSSNPLIPGSGNLQCFKNDAPFVGGPNTAPKTEGQCF